MYIAALRADLAGMFSSKKTTVKIADFFLKFMEKSEEERKRTTDKLLKMAARYKLDPESFKTVDGSLAFFKSLDYKKNPVPKEDFTKTELWKFGIRKAALQKMVSRAQTRKAPDKVGPDGKMVKRRRAGGHRRERTPFETFKRASRRLEQLDDLIDSFPVMEEDAPETPKQ